MRSVRLAAVALVVMMPACSDADAPAIESITEAALSADLHALAHDSMRGRLVGTPEIARASDWIAARFAALGLDPAGDDGTFDQRFDLAWFSIGAGNTLTVQGGGGARPAGRDWTPAAISASASAAGDVVFAGYGIIEPRLGWDDYREGDVAGKVVLILEREPGVDDPASPFDGVVTAEASRDVRKVLNAQERGAVAVLFVRDVHVRGDIDDWAAYHAGSWPAAPRRIERFTLRTWVDQITIPVAQVSADIAARLVGGSGRTLEQLGRDAEAAATGLGVVALPGARVSLSTAVTRHTTPGRNLLAMVEGADPALRNEVVIIGAHHDHNGADETDVFNGADDDGSGTVGVLAIAAAYAEAIASGDRPRRSVLFAVWDAEERGLLGAWHYTTRPRLPLQATVAKLNMDMIGRNEEVPAEGGGRFNGLEPQTAESNANAINLVGSSRTPQLADVVQAANRDSLTLRLRYDNNESNLLRRSDHWPFLQNGVPAVWFHTGLHPDYHTPLDDADRINYEKMMRIVRLVYRTSWQLASSETRPALEGMGTRPRS